MSERKHKRCEGTCVYHINERGDLIVCSICGRIKAIRELNGDNNDWKMMF